MEHSVSIADNAVHCSLLTIDTTLTLGPPSTGWWPGRGGWAHPHHHAHLILTQQLVQAPQGDGQCVP